MNVLLIFQNLSFSNIVFSVEAFKEWISFFWGLWKRKLQLVACKVNEPLNVRKKQFFFAYIYISLNQNLNEKSFILFLAVNLMHI